MKTAHDLVAQAKKAVQEISVDQAVMAIQSCDVLIDVRETDEYLAGHLPGAMHMSRGMLEFKMAGNPKMQSRDLNIVLYCKTSGRAALSAKSLAEMGYTGLFMPEQYGGAGLGVMENVLVVEQIARYCANTAILYSCTDGATPRAILALGSEAQKRAYLPAIVRGERSGVPASTTAPADPVPRTGGTGGGTSPVWS